MLAATWAYREVTEYVMTGVAPNEPFVALYFYVRIQRRQTYFLLNVIFPSVLISIMSVVSFYLPPDSGEKMSIGAPFSVIVPVDAVSLSNERAGMTVMLSGTLFLSLLSDMTPTTSESTPLIGYRVKLLQTLCS